MVLRLNKWLFFALRQKLAKKENNLLIIQHNIGSPNVVGRYVQLFYSTIFIWIPDEFVIIPKLGKKEEKKIV